MPDRPASTPHEARPRVNTDPTYEVAVQHAREVCGVAFRNLRTVERIIGGADPDQSDGFLVTQIIEARKSAELLAALLSAPLFDNPPDPRAPFP